MMTLHEKPASLGEEEEEDELVESDEQDEDAEVVIEYDSYPSHPYFLPDSSPSHGE